MMIYNTTALTDKSKLWMDYKLPSVSLNRSHSHFNTGTLTFQLFTTALNDTNHFISMFLCESLNESDHHSEVKK